MPPSVPKRVRRQPSVPQRDQCRITKCWLPRQRGPWCHYHYNQKKKKPLGPPAVRDPVVPGKKRGLHFEPGELAVWKANALLAGTALPTFTRRAVHGICGEALCSNDSDFLCLCGECFERRCEMPPARWIEGMIWDLSKNKKKMLRWKEDTALPTAGIKSILRATNSMDFILYDNKISTIEEVVKKVSGWGEETK